MEPMEYWKKYGHGEHLLGVLRRAGTTYEYWKHICHKRKRPSVDLARNLVRESGGELTLEKLLFPREELRRPARPALALAA